MKTLAAILATLALMLGLTPTPTTPEPVAAPVAASQSYGPQTDETPRAESYPVTAATYEQAYLQCGQQGWDTTTVEDCRWAAYYYFTPEAFNDYSEQPGAPVRQA